MMFLLVIQKLLCKVNLKRIKKVINDQEALERKKKEEGLWTIYFHGSVAKVGASASVYIISPIRYFKEFAYKLTFECTNNVAEYEALLLDLHALKDLGAKRVQAFGDSKLVINQVNDSYQTKHPRMRAYMNEVWDMFGNYFTEHSIKVVPRYNNIVVDSLAIATGKFKITTAGKRKYKVDIVNRVFHTRQYQLLACF